MEGRVAVPCVVLVVQFGRVHKGWVFYRLSRETGVRRLDLGQIKTELIRQPCGIRPFRKCLLRKYNYVELFHNNNQNGKILNNIHERFIKNEAFMKKLVNNNKNKWIPAHRFIIF